MTKINAAHFYMKSPELLIVTAEEKVFLKTRKGLFTIDGTPIEVVMAFFHTLSSPVKGSELTKILKSAPASLSEVFNNLLTEGIIEIHERSAVKKKSPACQHLVLGITGTVMAPQMVAIATNLLASGFCKKISVILTSSALKFVGKRSFEAYGIDVWIDNVEKETMNGPAHIELAESADMVLIMPASAHFLHRLASGACSDLLSLVAISTRAPLVVAPSANRTMYHHPAVQRNLQMIRQDHAYIIEPEEISGAIDFARGGEEKTGYGFNPYQKNLAALLFEVLTLHRKK